MNRLRQLWRRMVDVFQAGFASANPATRGSARTLEAEVLRERAEAVRLRDELARGRAEVMRQRAEATREQRENEQLRAENRALLNSILGIAGIPPVVVNAPLDELQRAGFADDASARSQGDVAAGLRTISTAIGDSSADDTRGTLAVNSEGGTVDQDSLPKPDRPESPAPRNALFGSVPGAHESSDGESFSGAGNASSTGGGRMRFAGRGQIARDARTVPHTRRRSWQQINRLLEFESAKKPVTNDL
jgi:hypothetical protein